LANGMILLFKECFILLEVPLFVLLPHERDDVWEWVIYNKWLHSKDFLFSLVDIIIV